jgi:dethiobiotin synthetase
MSTVFVTASGTDVGKTYVTCRLLRALVAAGHRCRALKPVVTGFDPAQTAGSDTGLLLEALGEELTPAGIKRASPWRFRAPLSPDMAAAREGRSVPFDRLLSFCRTSAADADITLIEGIGGVMVPLDGRHTVIDWIAALGGPALLVTASYVGTLSHTLTAAGALAARGIDLAGIVVSETPDSAASMTETVDTLARFLPEPEILALTRHAPEGAEAELRLLEKLLSASA